MKMIIHVDFEVNIFGDRVNANEIFDAVGSMVEETSSLLAQATIEGYQSFVVETLCRPSGMTKKRGLGGHEEKGRPGFRCRCRRFRPSGRWGKDKRLRGDKCEVEFRPRLVECLSCGKRFTPVLSALELSPYQRNSDQVHRLVVEAVADTSYRRGSHQLNVLGAVPVPKSTMHRWVAEIGEPRSESEGDYYLFADGTGFKRQPGERGEVRIALEMSQEGQIRPLGAWAGTPWKEIGKEIKDRLKGQPSLFVGDGEHGMEQWVSRLATSQQRSHWHLARDSRVILWQDKAPPKERKDVSEKLSRLLAIEIPAEDMEQVTQRDKQAVRERILQAEKQLYELDQELTAKGYRKAATYLRNAHERLFTYLRLWLQTGIANPRTASIVENTIREVGRRLKRVGWNWSNKGAASMANLVLVRRYDNEGWEAFWKNRMNINDRCRIQILDYQVKRVA